MVSLQLAPTCQVPVCLACRMVLACVPIALSLAFACSILSYRARRPTALHTRPLARGRASGKKLPIRATWLHAALEPVDASFAHPSAIHPLFAAPIVVAEPAGPFARGCCALQVLVLIARGLRQALVIVCAHATATRQVGCRVARWLCAVVAGICLDIPDAPAGLILIKPARKCRHT